MHTPGDDNVVPVFTPSRVLVTGASGFLGRHLIELLKSERLPFRTLGRRPPANVPKVLQDHIVADVRRDFVAAAEGCDSIVHLAGLSDASASFDNPIEFADTNVLGTIRALEAARKSNAAIII